MKRKTKRKKVKKSLTIVLLWVLSAILGFYVQRRINYVNEYVKVVYKTVNTEVVNKASIVMVGDALMHMAVNNSYKTSNGYDYTNMFKYIKPIVSEYDLKYYNQETICLVSEIIGLLCIISKLLLKSLKISNTYTSIENQNRSRSNINFKSLINFILIKIKILFFI